MEKDYAPSKIYSKDELDNLEVPYKLRDYCQDEYASFKICQRTHPIIVENTLFYSLPLLRSLTKCDQFQRQWVKCQKYREKELFNEMVRISELQNDLIKTD